MAIGTIAMNKKELSEHDITSEYVLDALQRVGWDESQIVREFPIRAGRVIARGRREQARARGPVGRADVVLCYKPNIAVAVIEVRLSPLETRASSPELTVAVIEPISLPVLLTVPL